ncbi:hypothetical protein BU15DRAFT_76410 [Melanogaster broomeanus]|nr:hypothetical protein BU15DRAFT_76410 [Melanogaster broomeanus]
MAKEQRLYDELYSSDAWIEEHDKVQKQQRQDGCKLERVIAGMMFWSDATHLAQFGHATAWPVYLFFGNLSKYRRASPNTGPCHPVAFIPSLPDSLARFIAGFSKNKNHADLLAHCKRELIHAIWRILLDDDFINAYKDGMVIKCYDGITRRVYPRIFTYSADYPEKIILATIRDKGICACPRCLIPKSSFGRLGCLSDMSARLTKARIYLQSKINDARRAIYQLGMPVKGTAVEQILKDTSSVPTLNTFAERLSPFGFQLFPIFVVDLLHEFELGVLKSVLQHLIRILYAINSGLVTTLNERFSKIPSFGLNAIRRFPPNVAEMRQRAARHFEDMLQATRLDQALRQLAAQIRKFQRVTCAAFQTRETPNEAATRQRKQARAASGGRQAQSSATQGGMQPKSFNTLTYKFHALGDYARTIRLFGTTDSYTTQVGELAHRLIKKFYCHTNKKDVSLGITKQERRLTRIRRQLEAQGQTLTDSDLSPSDTELLPELHHVMAVRSGPSINLVKLLGDHQGDPAVKNFIPKLKDHLLSRLHGHEYDGDEHTFDDTERNNLRFINNLNVVYESRIFRVNYTSYDIRRDQDVLRPGHGCTVMTLSREDDPAAHPFWYAHVLRALHIDILHVGPHARHRSPQTMEVLWVRWLGVEPNYRWGFQEARLPKVGFVPESDEDAFGFLDPSLVIRGCHLIPSFVDGRTGDLLRHGLSLGRQPDEVDDWGSFYVNIFADRDMFCRFAGIGVGHEIQYPKKLASGLDGEADTTNEDSESEDIGVQPSQSEVDCNSDSDSELADELGSSVDDSEDEMGVGGDTSEDEDGFDLRF